MADIFAVVCRGKGVVEIKIGKNYLPLFSPSNGFTTPVKTILYSSTASDNQIKRKSSKLKKEFLTNLHSLDSY